MAARRLVPLAFLTACTEYEFSKGGDPQEGDDELPADVFDTGWTDSGGGDGTGGSEDGEGDGDDTGMPPDEGAPDACWEPEDGYEQNAAAKLITTDGITPVTVTFVYSDSAYENHLYLESPEEVLLVRAWNDAAGSTSRIGPYPGGTELVFGDDVLTTGDYWKSGPATRNDDGVVHVAVTYEGDCAWLIGFEDIRGGGDLDFNDAVMRVQGMLRQER